MYANSAMFGDAFAIGAQARLAVWWFVGGPIATMMSHYTPSDPPAEQIPGGWQFQQEEQQRERQRHQNGGCLYDCN